jgi:hypothetical protein
LCASPPPFFEYSLTTKRTLDNAMSTASEFLPSLPSRFRLTTQLIGRVWLSSSEKIQNFYWDVRLFTNYMALWPQSRLWEPQIQHVSSPPPVRALLLSQYSIHTT